MLLRYPERSFNHVKVIYILSEWDKECWVRKHKQRKVFFFFLINDTITYHKNRNNFKPTVNKNCLGLPFILQVGGERELVTTTSIRSLLQQICNVTYLFASVEPLALQSALHVLQQHAIVVLLVHWHQQLLYTQTEILEKQRSKHYILW